MSVFFGHHDDPKDTQTDGTDLVVYTNDGERIVIGKVKFGLNGHISGEITNSKYASLINIWRPGDFIIVPAPDLQTEEPESFHHNVFDAK